ncbi:LOXE3 isomerase, partial [Amia calva]|nr:LOXE3 isomerase [Amia calva]
MAQYRISVMTGEMLFAGTIDNVFVTLVGAAGESERTLLDNQGRDFTPGSTGQYVVTCTAPLGELLLVRLDKEQYLFLPDDDWFCSKVVVTTPQGDTAHFPCYRWVSKREIVELREGKATKASDEQHPLLVEHRNRELQHHREEYSWAQSVSGLPQGLLMSDPSDLPAEVRYSFRRYAEFLFNSKSTLVELKLKGLADCLKFWSNMDDISRVFWFHKTETSEYVQKHWEEDAFFGYQCLNGCNPLVIRRCTKLPDNFPVTTAMVAPALLPGSSLEMEMQKGNIFLCDYAILDGLPANRLNNRDQHLAAPLCLLHLSAEGHLLPIAIQLSQRPGPSSPVFLRSDSAQDWLLAKVFVRCAEFCLHQLVSHLLCTHLIAEAFTVATLRCLPSAHPLAKLLVPHTRYTLQVNALSRDRLLGEQGIFNKYMCVGRAGAIQLMQRAMAQLSYSALCLPEDIAARGLETLPHFYYRDDGLRLWACIGRFVRGLVQLYYPSDMAIQQDVELQIWISEIFTHGFLGREDSGIPQSFRTVEEVIKFMTMVIFTVSAQHAAVNSGQYDFHGWMPNAPSALQRAPPTTKGRSSAQQLLQTLPDVNVTVHIMEAVWVLSQPSSDSVPLGQYPEERFTEAGPRKLIQTLQEELKTLSEDIKTRNEKLELPYPYLSPEHIESSVAI